MSDDSKFVFGTCVSERANFEFKKGDAVFSPIGFAEIVKVNDNDTVRLKSANPSLYLGITIDTDYIEHVTVEEWPYYD